MVAGLGMETEVIRDCGSCGRGPCNDGTLCSGGWRQIISLMPIDLGFLDAPVLFPARLHKPWHREQPRSPKPRIRKGRR